MLKRAHPTDLSQPAAELEPAPPKRVHLPEQDDDADELVGEMPPAEEAEAEAAPASLLDAWFRGGALPFLLKRGTDGVATGRADEEREALTEAERRIEAQNANRMNFARDLGSYSAGDLVTKHCEPYGHARVLFDARFHLQTKFFDARRRLTHCLLEHCESAEPLLLDARYFEGWLNVKLGQDYYQYASQL